jgi:hypothetical protein
VQPVSVQYRKSAVTGSFPNAFQHSLLARRQQELKLFGGDGSLNRLNCRSMGGLSSGSGAHQAERPRVRLGEMMRVVILGPGASGKSTLASRLGQITGLRVIELDKVFWQPDLAPTPHDQWVEVQQRFIEGDGWIMDGDLGPYDAVEVRLRAADTIIFLDFSVIRCAWRAVRRSRERADFWLWLLRYRGQSRPALMEAIADHAPKATLHVLHSPEALRLFVARVIRNSADGQPGAGN